MELVGFDHSEFLSKYWQQKPLLIRNPWKAWRNPLEPNELAGLACEDTIESRLIIGSTEGLSVEHGPIAEDRFDSLGTKDWTLLVQAVDHHVPEVAALLEPFRFIPNWRIDDVMVSFAADGGGVGAHFDQYDVFLIQGAGKRRWRIGGICDEASELLPNGDLKLLADFTPTDEWVLAPGDILYVPPGIAHDGVAVGEDCMTYSVGFRAPSRSDLIGGFMDRLVADMVEDDRYADPSLRQQSNPGEISAEALDQLHAMISERVAGRSAFARWFGEYSSDRKYPEVDWRPEEALDRAQLRDALTAGATIARNPASRFAFIEQADGLTLFVDGDAHDCRGELVRFAQSLCTPDQMVLSAAQIGSDDVIELTLRLVNQGSMALEAAS